MLYIAADHNGWQLKKELKRYLKNQLKVVAVDVGPLKHDPTDDYPVYSKKLTRLVVKSKKNKGILICKTGHGVCMVANKIKGGRAIIGYSIEGVEWGRRHEEANILCLAAKFLSTEHAQAIVKRFLATDFDGAERNVRRLQEIASLE